MFFKKKIYVPFLFLSVIAPAILLFVEYISTNRMDYMYVPIILVVVALISSICFFINNPICEKITNIIIACSLLYNLFLSFLFTILIIEKRYNAWYCMFYASGIISLIVSVFASLRLTSSALISRGTYVYANCIFDGNILTKVDMFYIEDHNIKDRFLYEISERTDYVKLKNNIIRFVGKKKVILNDVTKTNKDKYQRLGISFKSIYYMSADNIIDYSIHIDDINPNDEALLTASKLALTHDFTYVGSKTAKPIKRLRIVFDVLLLLIYNYILVNIVNYAFSNIVFNISPYLFIFFIFFILLLFAIVFGVLFSITMSLSTLIFSSIVKIYNGYEHDKASLLEIWMLLVLIPIALFYPFNSFTIIENTVFLVVGGIVILGSIVFLILDVILTKSFRKNNEMDTDSIIETK